MKPKSLAAAFAFGWFAILFLRNGTAVKGAKQAENFTQTVVTGLSKGSKNL